MSSFWSWYVTILTVGNILACYWLIRWAGKRRAGEAAEGDVTGHTWDGDLQEYNNPLPRWWLWMFYITIVFGLVYLALYPGLGNYPGALGWTQAKQYEEELARAEEKFGPIFAAWARRPIPELARDAEAMRAGQRLFLNYCATCHGSAATGAVGFPDLTDGDWLWGGDPDTIKETILDGRRGQMPPMAAALGDDASVEAVAHYVLSLSGAPHDAAKAAAGQAKFAACAACHGPDGKGNPELGAPNLTDDVWLHSPGPSVEAVMAAIRNGRSGHMPAHRDFLGEDKAHLLAAYVYSLSATP